MVRDRCSGLRPLRARLSRRLGPAWRETLARASWTTYLLLFLTTGVLGGFTTFSAFSLDALTLWERGALMQAGLYVAASVILSLLAAALGLMVTRAI